MKVIDNKRYMEVDEIKNLLVEHSFKDEWGIKSIYVDNFIKIYLNGKSELIEESKPIELPSKLEEVQNGDFIDVPSSYELMWKINGIIDYLKSKEEKKE